MSDPSQIATNESISFYPKHITILNDVAKRQNIRSKSATVQYIIEDYQKKQSTIKRDLFLYLGIPILFFILCYFTFYNLQKLEDILFFKNLYFSELTNLKNMFFIITLGIISLICTSMYALHLKRKKYQE